LLGLVREDEGIAGKILRTSVLTYWCRQLTINLSIKPQFQSAQQKEKRKTTTPALDEFGRDLTMLASEDKLDPSSAGRKRLNA